MNKAVEYIENIQNIIEDIKTTQADNIEKCAEAFAKTLSSGHRIHLFGTGHSHMLAEELFYRAGGLVNINPILEEGLMLHSSAWQSTKMERLEGYADIIYDFYGLQKDDLIVIISNSGRNGVCIDLAKLCREKGLTVVVLTNMKHTMSGASRHSSGKRLYEFGNIVLDNMGCVGDASMEIEALSRKVAPTSTVAGAMILNAVEARTVQLLTQEGFVPEVFSSSNVDGGDEINDAYCKKYVGEIRAL